MVDIDRTTRTNFEMAKRDVILMELKEHKITKTHKNSLFGRTKLNG